MLGGGIFLLVSALASAQSSPTPDVLQGLSLVQLDSHLGVAVLRGSAGEHRAMRAGELAPGNAYKLTRIYADRIELELPRSGTSAPARYWLWKGAPGEATQRLQPLVTNPPDEGRAVSSITTNSRDIPGSAR